MEFYSKGDLKKLITSRSLSSTRFSNEELIFHFRTLIKVFAEFQLKRVAHRDIKPENIFIGDDGELVVGDLGCADEVKANSSTIAGTPLYLSPEVREAYIERMSVGKSTKRYDVFISDVYSLGLTFIYMATLQEFTKVATSPLSAIDSLVQEKIAEVSHSYPQIAEQLRKMLKFKAEDRTSFIEIAFQIGIPLSISENFCKICEKKFKCNYFSIGMKLVCNTCYNQVLNLLEFHENSQ
jgi:serine/threonine protein kinase